MKKRWVKFTERECDLFTVFCIIAGYTVYFKDYIGFNFQNFLVVYQSGIVNSFRREDEYGHLLEVLPKKRKAFLSNLKKLEAQDKILRQYLKIDKLEKLTNKNFYKFFHNFVVDYQKYFALFTLPKYYGMVLKESDLSSIETWQLEKVRGVANYEFVQKKFLDLLFFEIGKRCKVEKELLFYALPSEIEEFLMNTAKVSQKILAERKRFCLVQVKKGKMTIFFGKRAQVLEKKELKYTQFVDKDNRVVGKSANPGRVKGVVKVVFRENDLTGLKGKVLVAPMTSIKFIPYIKLVKAIVTDEGGIACHAAIVSRELGIPCVIGTKIATKVFKDGDLVEVDAGRGIVRKIS